MIWASAIPMLPMPFCTGYHTTILYHQGPPERASCGCLLMGFPLRQFSSYRCMVQRLFSMFPAGAAGWGLLLLRVCAAGMLFRNCILDATVSIPAWEIAGVVILAGAFLLGVFTPVTCCLSALLQ